jgi:two-component system chemotaxis response regulator CheY
MGDARFEGRAGGEGLVQVHGIIVARDGGEGDHVVLGDGAQQACALPNAEILKKQPCHVSCSSRFARFTEFYAGSDIYPPDFLPHSWVGEDRNMAVQMTMPILVVDDYNTMVRIIRNLLKQLGFENVDEASDGQAALGKLRVKPYGLVISDWNMEPMTGYELLQQVRADDKLKTTPFIMITAESKTENVIAAKKAGVNNYIVKPFNAQTLKQKMASVLGDF